MAFSENQVRQLYVATASGEVNSKAGLGTIKAKSDSKHDTIWFEYKGAGGFTASDKIKVSNIVSMKSLSPTSMQRDLNRFKLILNDTVVAGQDYILRLVFRNYVGMSDEDQYWKYGMVHAVKNMTEDTFYKTLAISLAKNVARDDNKLVKIFAHSTAATAGKFDSHHLTEVTAQHTVSGGTLNDRSNNWDDGSKTVTDIDYLILQEVEQPGELGKFSAGKIAMEVQPSTIRVENDEVIWGSVTKEAPVKVGNGNDIADMEYFYMGKRGDIYRGAGWPNNINTKYLVDPSKTYDTLDITYFYAGDNEDVQKSQKTITIVADSASHTIMKAIIAEVNAATNSKPFAIPSTPEER